MADDIDLWEAHAGWWQDGFTDGADPEYEEQILPLAANLLDGYDRILDVGTGEGQVARLVADRLGHQDGIGVGVGDGGELREGAPQREPGLLLAPAHLVLTEPTRFARTTPAHERHDDPVAQPNPLHLGTHGHHTPHELVAAHVRTHDVGVGALPPVEVAAAQADGEHLHHGVERARGGIGHLTHVDRSAEGLVHRCSHGRRR